MNIKKLLILLLIALPLFCTAQEFLNIKELTERRTTVSFSPNKAEVVFIAGTNDLVITSTSSSVDKVASPRKNPTSGQYEYIVTLDLSESNMRHFTVEKKGTGFVARTKQKMIFRQGERHYIEVTEPEVKFTLNPMPEGTHLAQNEGCIEIVSPLPDLIVDAPKELGCDVAVTENSAGSYVTLIKINTIKLDGIRNKYKNQPESIEEQTTVYVRFENSNIASVSVKDLTQRKKLRYTVVPIGASAAAPANQVSNDFQYVVFKVTPSDALVRLDGELLTVNGGIASKYKSAGTYTYQVECPLYHSKTGSVTVAGKKEEVIIELEPAFGYINITGNSSKNGTVYIDKQKVGTAPLRSDKLPSGKHTVEIVKELYKSYSAEVVVMDGETTPMPVEMEANYAHVTFKAEEGVSIYINGQHEGKGQVVKDLTLGVYEVETKKEGCRPVKETYEITASMMNKTIPLEPPIPILGSVKIETSPSDATVLIDGEEKDKTPCALSLIIGKHTLTLKADGYAILNREIVVEEGKVTEVNIILNATTTSMTSSFSCGTSTVYDYDGNTYATVKIGTQCWMKENLRTTKYADGTSISRGSSTSTTVAYWYYPNNSSSNKAAYGLLYNWKAVMRNSSSSSANPSGVQGICPTGWHVPSDAEWKQMEMAVGMIRSDCDITSYRGNIAAELSGDYGWAFSNDANTAGNRIANGRNSSGFSALPAGHYSGSYNSFGANANFWSATEYNNANAWLRNLSYTHAGVYRDSGSKATGCSVRCLCDESANEVSPTTSTASPSNYVNKDVVNYSRQDNKRKKYNVYDPDIFFTINGSLSLKPQWAAGFKIGAVEKWGWNLSFMSNYNFKSYKANPMVAGTIYEFDDVKRTRLGITAGAVWYPGDVVLLFLNAGYGFRGVCYKESDTDSYFRYSPNTYHGAEVSAGLMFNINGFLVSAEITTINFKYMEFNIGIGGLIER